MCALPLSKVLPQRKTNSLDAERESFERSQSVSISKAINCQESPVKEKHVRSAIIGTFNEKGAGTFWNVVMKLPLQGNPIVCWKFCHVLHKVLREGHPNVILDSQKYKTSMKDLGKLWGLLKDGYGRLIQCYCNLLVSKLDFHRRNPRFPGNLTVTDEELDDIGERDVNVFFQLSCEFFDYMDEVLALQAAVFGSLDMSRSNSMTNCGQCRLAPLIPCIQDSSQLYDYTVKVLFKLHSALPPDTLSGHRERFVKQFKSLQQFYISASNLQYFKHLIHVPLLPEKLPNFLIASDLSAHVSPVVILPPHTDTPENETVDMNLIDTTIPKSCVGSYAVIRVAHILVPMPEESQNEQIKDQDHAHRVFLHEQLLMVHHESVEPGTTVNSKLYVVVLKCRVQHIRMDITDNWMYHDNAPAHNAFIVTDSSSKHGCHGSPSPCTVWTWLPMTFLFLCHKTPLKGKHFGTVNEIKAACIATLKDIPEGDYCKIFKRWKTCCSRYIDTKGDYFKDF